MIQQETSKTAKQTRICARNKRERFRVSLAFLFGIGFALLPLAARAATLYFVLPPHPVYQGDTFSVGLRVESRDAAINVVDAQVGFTSDTLEVVSFERSRSTFTLWPQEPSFSNPLGLVNISGGLPTPGFQDRNGLIGVLTVRAKKDGIGTIRFLDTSRTLLNDGIGKTAPLAIRNASLSILPPPSGYTPKKLPKIADTIPPQPFVPVVSHTEEAFGGRYFAIFEAIDRESGVDYYEVQEIKNDLGGEWKRAVSPYVLENQEGEVTILVKVVDRVGNETIGMTEATLGKKKILIYYFSVLILAVFLGFLFRKVHRVRCSRVRRKTG